MAMSTDPNLSAAAFIAVSTLFLSRTSDLRYRTSPPMSRMDAAVNSRSSALTSVITTCGSGRETRRRSDCGGCSATGQHSSGRQRHGGLPRSRGGTHLGTEAGHAVGDMSSHAPARTGDKGNPAGEVEELAQLRGVLPLHACPVRFFVVTRHSLSSTTAPRLGCTS